MPRYENRECHHLPTTSICRGFTFNLRTDLLCSQEPRVIGYRVLGRNVILRHSVTGSVGECNVEAESRASHSPPLQPPHS